MGDFLKASEINAIEIIGASAVEKAKTTFVDAQKKVSSPEIQILKTAVASQEAAVKKYTAAKEAFEKLTVEFETALAKEAQSQKNAEESAALAKKIKLNDEAIRQFGIAIKKTEDDIVEAEKKRVDLLSTLSTLDFSEAQKQKAVIDADVARLKKNRETLLTDRAALITQVTSDTQRQKALSAHKNVFTLTVDDVKKLQASLKAAQEEFDAIARDFRIENVEDMVVRIKKQRETLAEANQALHDAEHALRLAEKEQQKQERAIKQNERLAAERKALEEKLSHIPTAEELDAKVTGAESVLQSAKQKVASIEASLHQIDAYNTAKAAHAAASGKFFDAQETHRRYNERVINLPKTTDALLLDAAHKARGDLSKKIDIAEAELLKAKSELEAATRKLPSNSNTLGLEQLHAQLSHASADQKTAETAYKKALAEREALEKVEKAIRINAQMGERITAVVAQNASQQHTAEKARESFFAKAFRHIKEAFNSVTTFVKTAFNSLVDSIFGNEPKVAVRTESLEKPTVQASTPRKGEVVVAPASKPTPSARQATGADQHFFHLATNKKDDAEQNVPRSNNTLG